MTKPNQCTLVVGVPTTRQSFERASDALRDWPEDELFVAQFPGGWPQYRRLFLDECENALAILERLGVDVVRRNGRQGLARAFREREVVVLFSHWLDNCIELDGELVPAREIVDVVAPAFSGVFDLCVCHPLRLVALLDALRPRCVVRYTNTEVAPLVWAYLYPAVFATFKNTNATYVSALDSVLTAAIETEALDAHSLSPWP